MSDTSSATYLTQHGIQKRMQCSGQVASRIEETFVTAEQLVDAVESEKDLTDYDEIGPVTAEAIEDWWEYRFEREEKVGSGSFERTGPKTATVHIYRSWEDAIGGQRGNPMDSAAETSPDPTRIDDWSGDGVDLEVGFAGVCNECDTKLVSKNDESSLGCPDCGLLVAFIGRYPSVSGDNGVPGAEANWPVRVTEWEISDGRATVSYYIRGEHTECDAPLVENDQEEVRYGTPQDACCAECGATFGYSMSANIVEDPVGGDD